MTDNIFDKIREENIIKYGTDIDRYGHTLLANLYSDRTHFIYELIQNAEDACERVKKEGIERRFIIRFQLYQDRLEVRHNGIPFDEKDMRGICGLVEGTKNGDLSQIGKFGIGFKSVYAYTRSPEIYSGDKSFCIKNYVQPYSIEEQREDANGETLFVIPFNHDKITKDTAYSKIEQRLKKIGLRTLLFLRNIEEITWEIGSSCGKYSRSSKCDNNIRWVTLTYKDNEGTKNSEKWLIFKRPISNGYNNHVMVEIAYLLDKADKAQIVPARDTGLVAFFPTGKPTQLNFLIQGPYQTTPARDNIYDNDWNRVLIKETAVLVAESISKIKEMNLLDVSYLNTLPVEYDSSLTIIFTPIYKKVSEKLLSGEALLPAYNGGYTTPAQALIATGKDLRDLLSLEQLKMLFNRTKWLDENITVTKTPELRKYLMKECGVAEIDPVRFAKEFNEDFIKEQSDEWVKKFYCFLLEDQKALRREVSDLKLEGILRSKPIIRLEDDSHTRPFDSEGKPLVYLPSAYETGYPTVKKGLVDDEQVKNFLLELGLKGADIIDYIDSMILSKYTQEEVEISPEENINDVKEIFKLLINLSDERKHNLFKKLKETPFLIALNYGDQNGKYKKPSDIYVGGENIGDKYLKIYFEGNGNAWYLAEYYQSIIDVPTLKDLSCKTKIQVNCKEASYGTVTILRSRGHYKRGLDEFDLDCEIEGLEYALKYITLERAKIIWNILKEHYKCIYGTVESATHKDWSNAEKRKMFSVMGDLLIDYPWLPDKEGKYHKPSAILLSELHEEFDKESLEAKHVAGKLKFKTVVEDQLLEQLPDEFKDFYKELKSLSEKNREKAIDYIKSLKDEAERRFVDEPPEEIRNKIEEVLVTTPVEKRDNSQNGGWRSLTPEDAERIQEEYGNEFSDRLNKIQIIHKPKISGSTKIIDIDPKEFLLEQYDGHCQICNTRLDVGLNKKPFFGILRLFETRNVHGWTNMEFNVLCLCPNCHALMKHGGRDLKSVWETAEKVSKGEVAPEEVDERRGDYYIINVEVAGKEREIFYTSTHMAKLAAFIEQMAEKEEVVYDTKEEEQVLTPATQHQESEQYDPINDNKNLLPLITRAFEMAKRDDG